MPDKPGVAKGGDGFLLTDGQQQTADVSVHPGIIAGEGGQPLSMLPARKGARRMAWLVSQHALTLAGLCSQQAGGYRLAMPFQRGIPRSMAKPQGQILFGCAESCVTQAVKLLFAGPLRRVLRPRLQLGALGRCIYYTRS